jgi:transcriptional regulator with PAS, ATPase and Fis domain
VGELPVHLQAKLLRAIQEQRFYRIGGTREIQVDVRWLAATNRNLEEAVRRGQFREDLYYRLKVITIEMPPLRQRIEDVPRFAEHFLGKFAERHGKRVDSILPEAMQCLQWYSWPGNVRQLENLIERLVVLAEEPTIRMRDLPKELARPHWLEDRSGRTQNVPRMPWMNWFL